MSPDAIQFRGEKKIDFTRLRLIDYDLQSLQEKEVEKVGEVIPFDTSETTSWLNVDGLHDEEIMHELSSGFELDSLIISRVLDTHVRPGIHEYENCLFLSAKMLSYNETDDYITSENLVLIVKEHLLISFQEAVGDVFEPVRERLRKNRKRIRSSGTDYLAFALLDVVIDNYIYIISRIGEKIEQIDDELISNPTSGVLHNINKYKGEINYLAKIINPCREMIFNLVKSDSDYLSEEIEVHLKELQDNINLANDSIESYRQILSDQLSIFHSNVSNKLNEILKVLTIISVVFIPLSFIAGIFGTNFEYIPLTQLKYGYFIMWGFIIAVAAGMLLYFRRKRWF